VLQQLLVLQVDIKVSQKDIASIFRVEVTFYPEGGAVCPTKASVSAPQNYRVPRRRTSV
jgi:hypothetical protein